MTVETLGDALSQGWRVTVRCAQGPSDGMKGVKACSNFDQLDLKTLVWTRGRDFPIARLESRMKCLRCGSRRVTILFDVPKVPMRAAG